MARPSRKPQAPRNEVPAVSGANVIRTSEMVGHHLALTAGGIEDSVLVAADGDIQYEVASIQTINLPGSGNVFTQLNLRRVT